MPRLAASLLALLLVAGLAPAAISAAPVAPAAAAAPASSVTTAAVLEGIDVSHWQGTITWSKVAAAGKKFAIIKASEDTDFVDDHYLANRSGAQSVGILTGAYHFARPDTSANDAVLEADHFWSTIRLGAGDLIPALDLEDSGGLSVTALQAWVTAFVNRVWTRTGVKPMIYTSPAFWSKYMGGTRTLADAGFKLWIAHWGVTSPTVAGVNWGGHGYTFWQYTSSGAVNGITGRVDLDRFNGSDLASVAYSVFSLKATAGSQVKQGQTGPAATVGIVRTNFTSQVSLQVAGLPAGATATFNTSPTTLTSATLHVTTSAPSTPTGTYPLTITGVGEGLTRTTKVNLVVADGMPPIVNAPFTAILSGATMGSASAIVRVSWSASDPSGIASYRLQRSVGAGGWVQIGVPNPAAGSADQSFAYGYAYRQRGAATDRLANASVYTEGPSVRMLMSQQGGPTMRYTGTWHSQNTSSASGGSWKYSTAKGALSEFTFTGSSIGWVAARGPDRGSAKVYIDGVYSATVNLYSTSRHSRVVVFARNWSTTQARKITIQVVGTAGHSRVDVDAFLRLAIE